MDNDKQQLLAVLIAGIAVQRLIEVADPLLERWASRYRRRKLAKKTLATGAAILVGWVIAGVGALGYSFGNAHPDMLASIGHAFLNGLLIGGGTETFNSLIKLLSYAKENTKGSSGSAVEPQAAAAALPDLAPIGASEPPPRTSSNR